MTDQFTAPKSTSMRAKMHELATKGSPFSDHVMMYINDLIADSARHGKWHMTISGEDVNATGISTRDDNWQIPLAKQLAQEPYEFDTKVIDLQPDAPRPYYCVRVSWK